MLFNKKLGFYCSNLDSYIDNVRNGDLGYLSLIFCVFAEDSNKHKLIAAKVLNQALTKFSLDDIYRIDRQMRETTSMEWNVNWRSLGINSFITNQMSDDERCAVFAFASFNPNGYIRERAIQALAIYKNSIPFILLRCNDWVYQVRQSALVLLSEKLSSAKTSSEEIVNALPVMEKLRRSVRCEYSDILTIVTSIFETDNSLIEKGLDSKDVRARRFCVSIINKLGIVESGYLDNHIKHEHDPFLRKIIFQILLNTKTDIAELSNLFLRDKYPPNRALALNALHENKLGLEVCLAENMLMDKNAQVRELARKIVLCSKTGFDVRQYYLNNISVNTVGSIYGLGEVGLSEDCNLIEKLLSVSSVSVVRAAMTALMRLDSERYICDITAMLAQEHSGIVKTATLLLKKSRGYNSEEIFIICDSSQSENTKIKCATLLFLTGKWKSLIYTLRLIGSGHQKLECLCQMQINRWIFSYNRSYAVLSENDSRILKKLLNEKKELLGKRVEQILFAAK